MPAALDPVEEVAYFKQALTVLNRCQLGKLVQFCTGVPRFPPGATK